MFNTLSTVPNSDFAAHIRDERRAWELSMDKHHEESVVKAVTIYNNAVSANRLKEKDLMDAKISALTTKIDELVEQQEKLTALATNANMQPYQNSNGNKQPRDRIQTIVE